MDSFREAFKKSGKPEFRIQMTPDQVKYAYIVCERTAGGFLDLPALGHEDLVQTGIEGILKALKDNPKLHSYNAWMGKVAKWEMISALRANIGRKGFYSNGNPRRERPKMYSSEGMEFEPSYTEEPLDKLIVEEMKGQLTETQLEAVELLQQGYTQTEIGEKLGVTSAAIMIRRQAAKRRLEKYVCQD